MTAPLTTTADGVRIALHVQPRSARTELAGLHGGALKIRLTAPPVEGAANLELLRFLATLLDVSRSDLELISGSGSRRKVILVRGVTLPAAREKLGL